MYKFLRIIIDSEYEEYLTTKTIYRYVPKGIFNVLKKYIKPRFICNYISRQEDIEVGTCIGMFLEKNKLIEEINKLTDDEIHSSLKYLLVDNLPLSILELKEIEEKCNIRVLEDKAEFVKHIPSCLDKICKEKKEELEQKEVFILSDDTKITRDLVNSLALKAKFISIYSEELNFSCELEEEILSSTGLALNISKDIRKSIDNFDFIINLNKVIDMNEFNISRNKIIIDLNTKSYLIKDFYKKRTILIHDLLFKRDENIFSGNGNCELDTYIGTSLVNLLRNENRNIEKIRINSNIYSIKEGLSITNFSKSDTSDFKKV